MQCQLRLKKELERFHNDPFPGISYWRTENICQLKASIVGPDDTSYENGVFYLDIQIPEMYPFHPPNVRFLTPVYHPNIDDSGRICHDALKLPPQGSWKPSLNISGILIALQLLLAEPNCNHPLMADIAQEYQMNRASFNKHAKEWTDKFAKKGANEQQTSTSMQLQTATGNCTTTTKRSIEVTDSEDTKKRCV